MTDGRFGLGKTGSQTESAFIAWSKRMFASINVGGQWAVPRSGLIWEKRSETELVLVTLVEEYDIVQDEQGRVMTNGPAQIEDYELIKRYMEAGGITVSNETDLYERSSDG
jgi:hypothetical protein